MNRFTPTAFERIRNYHYRAISQACFVSPRTAYRWQQGEASPDKGAAERLAAFLGLPLAEVIAEDRPTIADVLTPAARKAGARTRWINAGRPKKYRRPAYKVQATGHANVRKKFLLSGGVRYVVSYRAPGVEEGPWTRSRAFERIQDAIAFEATVNAGVKKRRGDGA
jgi:transcriptional regulator with XRE-family HTH domain